MKGNAITGSILALALLLPLSACSTSDNGRKHHGTENAAIMFSLEYLHHDCPDDGSQAVAEHALRQHHDVDQQQCRRLRHRDQRRIADRKTEATRGPYPFAPEPVREMSKNDLAGNAKQADRAQCPDRDARAETDVQKIFGLVNLHRVPDIQCAEITDREPPEARRAKRAAQGPVDVGPIGVDDIRDRFRR